MLTNYILDLDTRVRVVGSKSRKVDETRTAKVFIVYNMHFHFVSETMGN